MSSLIQSDLPAPRARGKWNLWEQTGPRVWGLAVGGESQGSPGASGEMEDQLQTQLSGAGRGVGGETAGYKLERRFLKV